MITRECLIKLRDEKERKYIEKGNSTLPKPLFINGLFNQDNWSAGDAILREFIYYLNEECNDRIMDMLYKSDLLEDDSADGSENPVLFMASHYIICDEKYTVINIHQDQTLEFETYTIKWYKDRGRIDHITLNGKLITEEEYLKLLNFIQDFKIYDFKINNK